MELLKCRDMKTNHFFFVPNISHPKDPFKEVKLKTTRFFSCEKRCHRFSRLNCAVIPLVLQNIVKLFSKIYNKRHETLGTCLTKMSLANMPKSRRQKNKEIIGYGIPQRPSLDQPFHLTFLAGIVK